MREKKWKKESKSWECERGGAITAPKYVRIVTKILMRKKTTIGVAELIDLPNTEVKCGGAAERLARKHSDASSLSMYTKRMMMKMMIRMQKIKVKRVYWRVRAVSVARNLAIRWRHAIEIQTWKLIKKSMKTSRESRR